MEGIGGMAILIVLSGLPGVGKSAIARRLAREIGAVWLRIDSVEQAIRDSDISAGPMQDAGYRAACAVARDNLSLGADVIGDCVNDWAVTRDAWRETGLAVGARVLEVELVCSDPTEHRRRVESRLNDVAGLAPPSWEAVVAHDYHPWDREHLIVDTAGADIGSSVAKVRGAL